MSQTTIPTAPPDDGSQQEPHNVDAHMPPQPTAPQDPVWATPRWNPDTNEWAPSNEPHDVWGTAEPSHGDDPTADPMSESYGRYENEGTVPDARLNLIDSVRQRGPLPAPVVEHHHTVETIEQGSPNWRVRQVTVQGNLTPTQLVEENGNRKRCLLRILPASAGASVQAFATAPVQSATITVPAGQTWTLQFISFLFTADAVVANRFVRVRIFNPLGVQIYLFVDATALTANQSGQVNLAPGNPTAHTLASGTIFTITGNLPAGLVLGANSQIAVDAVGADAGDQLSAGNVQFLLASAGAASVFVAPRYAPGAVSASQMWWKLIAGDSPLEIKVAEGIDAICQNATDVSTVMVLEETESSG